MDSTLEINNLSVAIDKSILGQPDSDIISIKGWLPALGIPFSMNVVSVEWVKGEPGILHLPLMVTTTLETVDPRWSVKSGIQFLLSVNWDAEALKWREMPEHLLEDIRLGEESVIYLDNHKWDLVATLNKLLKEQKEVWPGMLVRYLIPVIEKASEKYFNSGLLPNLMDDLYFRFSRENDQSEESIWLTASGDRNHFTSSDQYPPYSFLQIPTADFEYFLNHFVNPQIEIKGYELVFQSLEIIGVNELIVNIKETNNDWNIKMDIAVGLRDNFLYFSVRQIDIEGLNILKRLLFQMFKRLLIRQIEGKPLPLDKLYANLKRKLEEKFRFLKFMDGYAMTVGKLQFQTDVTELLVRFEKQVKN